MAIYLIQHRWTRRELAAIEAPSYARALEWAARRGMSLIDVDLAGIDLRGAFLAGADLRGSGLAGADLSGCYLRRADLRGADLREARLAHAFLGSADLRRADLREADLSLAPISGARTWSVPTSAGRSSPCARLEGALCDWRWAAIPAELLRQQHGHSGRGFPAGRRPGLPRRPGPLELAEAARRPRPPRGLGARHPGRLGPRRRQRPRPAAMPGGRCGEPP